MDKGTEETNEKEINIKLGSSIDALPIELTENIEYNELKLQLPAWSYIRLYKKGFFDRDFLLMLARSTCDVGFLKEIIMLEDKKQKDAMKRVFDNIETIVIDENNTKR